MLHNDSAQLQGNKALGARFRGPAMYPQVQPAARWFEGFPVYALSPSEQGNFIRRCQFDKGFVLPLPGNVCLGNQNALFANPACTINSVEPAINISRRAVLNPDAPELISGQNNSMQPMGRASSNRLCSLPQMIEKMSNIAFCLNEFWRRDLTDDEMQKVMSFPYVWSMCIYFLTQKYDVLEAADLSKGKALNTRSNVIEMVGTKWKAGSINEKFLKESFINNNNDGSYRHQLGEEVSNIVKRLKTLQADNKSKSQRTEGQSDGQQ
nr:hypothetical protein [Endozoicomonas sp.]